jgi:CubicO group peptidase (beta-lactamase class C family)
MTADMPFQGTATARAIARMYAALLDEVDGVRLVSPERLARMSVLATAGMDDEMTESPSIWAMGYSVGGPGMFTPAADSRMSGMVGIGGTAAYANRDTGVSYAVTKNRFNPIEIAVVEQIGGLLAETFA